MRGVFKRIHFSKKYETLLLDRNVFALDNTHRAQGTRIERWHNTTGMSWNTWKFKENPMDTNTPLHTSLAESLFRVLPTVKTEKLPSFGLDAAALASLNALTVNEQHVISQRAGDYLTFNVNTPLLLKSIEEVSQERQEKALEDDFIINGATVRMMRDYFGMHSTEYSARRNAFGMKGAGQHRPAYCDADTEAAIWQRWRNSCERDERVRLLDVSEATGEKLGTVLAVINRKSQC